MIKMYKTNESNMVERVDEVVDNCWIDLVSPTKEEIEVVSLKTGIDKDLILKMLDEEETPRFEKEDDSTLIVIDSPYIGDDLVKYSTLPLGIITGSNKYILTISSQKLEVLKLFKRGKIKDLNTSLRSRFTIQILYENAKLYLKYLRMIDKEIDKTEKELHNLSENEELINVLNIEKSLVYFITSLKENKRVIEKINRGNVIPMYEEDLDLLEDASIENEQASEMANIYREILSSVSDTYATLISNNLNIAMKILTSITIIFSVPTMVASFLGMNVHLGIISEFKYGFLIIIAFCIIVSIIIALIFKKKKLL